MTADFSDLHQTIFAILEKEISEVPESYNKKRPYQSYERIQFPGIRWSVEKRIAEYGLTRFLGPDKAVLDIGSNFGFFVTEFAMTGGLAHGVEWNGYLNDIGRATAQALGVSDKVDFFTCSFEDFVAPTQYDVVFSLAAFYTADGHERTAARDYFGKIASMLKQGGVVFYESTSYTKTEGSEAYSHYLARTSVVDWLQENMELVEQYETPSGSEGYFRQFAVARRI